MLTAPTNWSEWWQDPESKLLLYITIIFGVGSYTSSTTYSNEHLRDCMLEGSIASDVTLGNVTSKRLSFTLVNPGLPMSMFPRGEKITFKVALSKGGSTTSQVNQGTYFIDDASVVNDADIRITAYDGMHFMTGVSFAEKSADTTLATYITQLPSKYRPTYTNLLNTTVKDRDGNNRTVGSITIPKAATGIDCQKVLASVATIAGGNIGIDKNNDFVLYRYSKYIDKKTSVSHSSDVDVTVSSLSIANQIRISPGVTVDGAQSGYGTMIQGTLDKAFTEDETVFSNYLQDAAREVGASFVNAATISAQGALVSPLIEAGDGVYVKTGVNQWSSFPVFDYHLNYNNGCWGSVGMNMSDDAMPLMVDGATWKTARLGEYDTSATTTTTQVSITGTHTFTITFGVRTPSVTTGTRDYAIIWRVAAGANNIGRLSNVTLAYSVRGVRTSQTVTGYLLNQYSGTVQYYSSFRQSGKVTYEYYTSNYFPVDDIVGQVTAGIVLKEQGSTEEGITAIIQYAKNGIFIPKPDNYVLEPDWSYPLSIEQGGTGAEEPTLVTANVITPNNDNISLVSAQCAKWGKAAMLNITIHLKTALSTGNGKIGNIEVGTLAEAYRPAINTVLPIPKFGGTVYVDATGKVNIASFLPNISIATNTNLYIRGSYILA